MENASKALIIAGAIILSILIIGIGMYIFNMANQAISDTGLTQQQMAQFNSQFDSYKGTKVSGSKVMLLCDAVKNNNLAYPDDLSKQVALKDTDVEATGTIGEADNDKTISEITKKRNAIRAGYTYNVTMCYDTNTGLICAIGIKSNNK